MKSLRILNILRILKIHAKEIFSFALHQLVTKTPVSTNNTKRTYYITTRMCKSYPWLCWGSGPFLVGRAGRVTIVAKNPHLCHIHRHSEHLLHRDTPLIRIKEVASDIFLLFCSFWRELGSRLLCSATWMRNMMWSCWAPGSQWVPGFCIWQTILDAKRNLYPNAQVTVCLKSWKMVMHSLPGM